MTNIVLIFAVVAFLDGAKYAKMKCSLLSPLHEPCFALRFKIINTQRKIFCLVIFIPKRMFFMMKVVSQAAQIRGDYHMLIMLCLQLP